MQTCLLHNKLHDFSIAFYRGWSSVIKCNGTWSYAPNVKGVNRMAPLSTKCIICHFRKRKHILLIFISSPWAICSWHILVCISVYQLSTQERFLICFSRRVYLLTRWLFIIGCLESFLYKQDAMSLPCFFPLYMLLLLWDIFFFLLFTHLSFTNPI